MPQMQCVRANSTAYQDVYIWRDGEATLEANPERRPRRNLRVEEFATLTVADSLTGTDRGLSGDLVPFDAVRFVRTVAERVPGAALALGIATGGIPCRDARPRDLNLRDAVVGDRLPFQSFAGWRAAQNLARRARLKGMGVKLFGKGHAFNATGVAAGGDEPIDALRLLRAAAPNGGGRVVGKEKILRAFAAQAGIASHEEAARWNATTVAAMKAHALLAAARVAFAEAGDDPAKRRAAGVEAKRVAARLRQMEKAAEASGDVRGGTRSRERRRERRRERHGHRRFRTSSRRRGLLQMDFEVMAIAEAEQMNRERAAMKERSDARRAEMTRARSTPSRTRDPSLALARSIGPPATPSTRSSRTRRGAATCTSRFPRARCRGRDATRPGSSGTRSIVDSVASRFCAGPRC